MAFEENEEIRVWTDRSEVEVVRTSILFCGAKLQDLLRQAAGRSQTEQKDFTKTLPH